MRTRATTADNGSPSARPGRTRWGQQDAQHIGLKANKTFDEIEPGEKFERERRIHPPRNRKNGSQNTKEQDQEKPPQEVRHGDHNPVDPVDKGLGPSTLPEDRGAPQNHANKNADKNSDTHKFEGWREMGKGQLRHTLLERDGRAEISCSHVGEIDRELLRNRLVQPVKFAKPLDIGLGGFGADHHGDRISGHDAQQHKHNDCDPEQRGDRKQQAFQDIAR